MGILKYNGKQVGYGTIKLLTVDNMEDHGAFSTSLNCGESVVIPEGYHNGNGQITANSLSSQTGATASANQILNGQTAWVNGTKVTGTMVNRGAWVKDTTGSGKIGIPAGYHDGNGYVSGAGAYDAGVDAGHTAGYNEGYAAGQTSGTEIALTSTTLVDHIYDDTQKNYFFASGQSGTRWSWTNTLGNCKVLFYVELDKKNWDGDWGIHVYRRKADGTRNQLFSHQEYSGHYHGYSLSLGQTIEIDADDSNTRLKGCLIVLYSF